MHIDLALQIIDEMTSDELKTLTRAEIMFIVDGMNGEDASRFFMEKNVKVFGGIDRYVSDFLDKVNLVSMNSRGKDGARAILNKMLVYPGISDASKARIQGVLRQISVETAPAAGGKRRKTRKTKGLKRSRVRR